MLTVNDINTRTTPIPVKLADRKMSMKKEKIPSYLFYNIITFLMYVTDIN